MGRIRRFRLEYDHHVNCCCSVEEHLSGEYVTYEDYMNLLREYSEYRGATDKPDEALCAVRDCTRKAVQMFGGRPHCQECLPPMLQPGWEFPAKFDQSD